MKVLEKVKTMPIEEFYRVCNRLVKEMGFRIRNGVYRENTVVFDAFMPVPGGEIRYIIIFIRKDSFNALDLEDLVDFETLQIRWMIITTGRIEESAREKVPENMDVTLMDGADFERLLLEFGIVEEGRKEGSYLPSAGKLDEELAWAEEFLAAGNYQKAMEHVEQALRIKSTPRGLKIKARILNALGKYDEAVSILTGVLESNVRDDEAWFILAEVLENMGREEEAEEAYGQCVRFNPRNLGCWLNRGNILFSMGKLDEALLCYEKALSIRQDVPDAWNNRGIVLKHLGKYDEAMRSYNAALKYDPDFARAYLNKAILFFDMRRYEEAENAAYEYLKREEGEEGYLLLANIYLKRQMLGKAEEMARRALEINPGSIEARKILRKITGGKARDVGEDLKRSIGDILAMLPEGEMDGVREALREAQELATSGDLEGAKDKLEEAKKLLRDYVDEQSLKKALMEDIIEIAQESGTVVGDDLESMSLEELRDLRARLIRNIKRRGAEEKTREKLLESLKKIRQDLERGGLLNGEIDAEIKAAEEHITAGEFTEAIEVLLGISAKIERRRLDEMREFLVEDTRELLRDAGMEIPGDLDSMDIPRLRELRAEALEKLKGGKGSEEENALRTMVAALGGAVGAAGTRGIRDEVIGDIVELSRIAGEEVPEDLESMGLEELRDLRREIIERLKTRATVEEGSEEARYPGGFAQVLLETGKIDLLLSGDIDEDEYLANAIGIIHFQRGEYEKAAEQFKRALAINPELREAEFNLGIALIKMGNEEEGRMHLRRIGMEEFAERKI